MNALRNFGRSGLGWTILSAIIVILYARRR
jgi:hypothetical protein